MVIWILYSIFVPTNKLTMNNNINLPSSLSQVKRSIKIPVHTVVVSHGNTIKTYYTRSEYFSKGNEKTLELTDVFGNVVDITKTFIISISQGFIYKLTTMEVGPEERIPITTFFFSERDNVEHLTGWVRQDQPKDVIIVRTVQDDL